MKRTAVLLSVALAGCAGLTNPKFDSVEYGRYIDISTHSKMLLAQCGNFPHGSISASLLHHETVYATNYSAMKVQNGRVTAAGEELKSLTKELSDRYSLNTPSTGYCQLKLGQIVVAAETIATSIGKKED